MTDQLKTLMHQRADGVAFDPIDVATLTRTGDRAVRRRRTVRSAAVGVTVLACVGAGAVVARGRDGADQVRVADTGSLATDTYSWARGSVLHTGTSQVDVGHPIKAYVRTALGYVFTDGEGAVYAVDDSGVRHVGATSTAQPVLVSDPRGALAAWVDPTGPRPAFVVLDQASGAVTRDDQHTTPEMVPGLEGGSPAAVYAIVGTVVYRHDHRGAVAVDTADGSAQVLDATAGPRLGIAGAGPGVVAFDTVRGTQVGATRATARPIDGLSGSPVEFSPDGRYVTSDSETLDVFDVADGNRIAFDLDRGFAFGLEWLDDDTLVVVAAQEPNDDAAAELLTCTVPAGVCHTVVTSVGTFTELSADGAFPAGIPFD